MNVVQVGLGNNATFLQNLAGTEEEWDPHIKWLLECVSEDRPEHVSGIGVEPVEQHVRALEHGPMTRLSHVALVQVALGEDVAEGVAVHALTEKDKDALLQQVRPAWRDDLGWHLEYLMNMSCVGGAPPAFEQHRRWLQRPFSVDANLEVLRANLWSYGMLAQTLNFRGCEILIVDTEGHDAKILRSMIAHCQEQENNGFSDWPEVVQFETMSHCDKVEGKGTEWRVITQLQEVGYELVHFSHRNSQLVRKAALLCPRIHKWAGTMACRYCQKRYAFPYLSDHLGTACTLCCYGW